MATIMEIKQLLKKALAPINSELRKIMTSFEGLKNSVKFLSDKYDDLLKQIKSTNEKLTTHSTNINSIREDVVQVEKNALEALRQTEEMAQYLRRDCLEITGVKAIAERESSAIVQVVGKAMGITNVFP